MKLSNRGVCTSERPRRARTAARLAHDELNGPAPGHSSAAEVTNIDRFGIWMLVAGKEHFLPYKEYPWFHGATVREILNVEFQPPDHLHWPDLDVDLCVESLERPGDFPLLYHKHAVAPKRR